MKLLTKTQADTLDYMTKFFYDNDQLPPCHVIASQFLITENAALSRLNALRKKKRIAKNAVNKYKFVRL